MTDHAEEQSTEIEALESIYYDSFTVISENPHCFELIVAGEAQDDEDEEEKLSVALEFTFTPKYPDEAPLYEVKNCENLNEDDEGKIAEIIDSEIENNLGIVMIFTIATTVQEFLNDIKDAIKRREEEEKERKEREIEEQEKKKFHGTPVTVETFLAWKLQFEVEMKELNKVENITTGKRKLTGKELFLTNQNLLESELLEGEKEGVTIDESLFEDLDDLDLDDDDDDDPDFDPNS